jgi:hypothetical protein
LRNKHQLNNQVLSNHLAIIHETNINNLVEIEAEIAISKNDLAIAKKIKSNNNLDILMSDVETVEKIDVKADAMMGANTVVVLMIDDEIMVNAENVPVTDNVLAIMMSNAKYHLSKLNLLNEKKSQNLQNNTKILLQLKRCFVHRIVLNTNLPKIINTNIINLVILLVTIHLVLTISNHKEIPRSW